MGAPSGRGPDEVRLRAAVVEVGPAVRRFLHGMGADWGEAEDMAQEALLRAWRHRARFDGRADVRTWIFSIARNHWFDQLRRRRAAPGMETMTLTSQTSDAQADPSGAASRMELAEAVRRALQTLPAEQREALALRESEGLTFAQAAEVLDVSINTVKSRVRYALLKLAGQLKDFGPNDVRTSGSKR